MADFPQFIQIPGQSNDTPQTHREAVTTNGGVVFVRSFYHFEDVDLELFLDLDNDDVNSLFDHWRNHVTLSFNVTYDRTGDTLLCRYIAIPIVIPSKEPGGFLGQVSFVEVDA